jgi:hypothetical protein
MVRRSNLPGAWRYRGWLIIVCVSAVSVGIAYAITSATAQDAKPNGANREPAVLEAPLGARDLSSLFARFQFISSLHFLADAEIVLSPAALSRCIGPAIEPPNAIVGDNNLTTIVPAIFGRMEYWMSGDRYRVNNYVDPSLYPGMDTQFAYDGQRFQLLRPSAGTLSYCSQDNNDILMTLPNPILELIQFCYPVTDADFQRRLRLKDVVHAQAPVELQNIAWEAIRSDGRALHRAQFPGGTYEGRNYVHDVYTLPSSHDKPRRIDRITADGTRITSSEFSRYLEVATADGPAFWPQRIVLRAFDGNGIQAGKISFSITEFSMNDPARQDVFTISTEGVEHVWDGDLKKYVRHAHAPGSGSCRLPRH